jgi:hypothetical protein
MAESEAVEEKTEELSEDVTEETSGETGEEADAPEADSLSTSWRDDIKDADLRKHAERFTTPEALVKANLDYRKKEGRSVTKLSEESSEKDVEAYREAVGVPKDVDGYEFPLPEGMERTEDIYEREDKWANLFLNHNVPKEAADAIYALYGEEMTGAMEAGAESDAKYASDSKAALKAEWKDDYDKNMIYAARASEKLFGDDYEDARYIEDKAGNYILDNPILSRVFANLGRQMGEGNLGGVVTDGERDTLMAKANSFRQQAKDAHRVGNTSEANKFAAKELEVLTVLNGSDPVVGANGRQF